MKTIGLFWRAGFLAATLLFPALTGAPAHAQDQGDPVNGRRLADAWCSNCHVFDGSNHATATGAPAFQAIAANKEFSPLALRVFLTTPHERMPDLHLSNNEMDDLIAFILSSRGKP
jgi:mono/diheme cytochrome c family protein